MKTFEHDLSSNPTFNTVTGLSNTTFDPTTYVSNRGATEGQIKVVHDTIKALQDWLDENGCSDDPYLLIKAKVDELEAAIDDCCANPQDSIVQELRNRIEALEQWECQSETGYIDSSTCDGNEIIVNFQWDNLSKTSGKATATSSMSDHNIVSYDFLGQISPGIYKKTKVAGLGDFHWEIDNSGNVTMVANTAGYSEGGALPGVGIIVTDDHGCEGINNTSFWSSGSSIGG